MYLDMKAYINTNFGNTETFNLTIGVLQGSVLAAVLFLIFIDQLSDELRPHGIVINKLQIANLLFADDITLFGNSKNHRLTLTDITVDYLTRWRAKVNFEKSKFLSPHGAKESNKYNIDEVRNSTSLGIDISTTELFTLQQAKIRRAAASSTVREIAARLVIGLNGLDIDAAQFIYDTKIATALEYDIELINPTAYRLTILDKPHIEFIQLMLSQPAPIRSELLQAEVGTILSKYRASKKIILKYHHLKQTKDELTLYLIENNKQSPNSFYNGTRHT